ncbi:hypothetical protein [Lentisalinibacter sediminis]|uniref:hypothetical protein n=1 Tax=Lentisalinibacter sediminis TaxID=2992237 RepID=UPI0038690AA6
MTHRTSINPAGLAMALAVLLLAACGSEEPASSDQSTDQVVAKTSSTGAEDVPKKATTAEIAARQGDSPGKPVAPIDIDYEVLGEPRPGEPVEIELKLRSSLEGPVTVQLQPREGLQMGASQPAEVRRETLRPLVEASSEPATERVVVIPSAEGRFYLSVLVSVATAEGEQIRAVSIPVQVGDQPPTLQQNGELRTTEGETVRSLPAKESGGN